MRRHVNEQPCCRIPPHPYASRAPGWRPGGSGPNSVHKIVAQISGRIPNPKNVGVYEYRSTTHPVISVNSMPPKPDPMLARPYTDPTADFGNTSAGKLSMFARQPV